MTRKAATPNQVLTNVYGTSTTKIVNNLLRVFDAATPAEFENGVFWYRIAGDHAEALATHTGSVSNGAALLAALSPRCRWDLNVAQAYAVATGADRIPRPLLPENLERAHDVLANGIAGLGKGPKVNAFYANIMGDEDSVTIDTWAVRAALLSPVATKSEQSKLSRVGVYDALANAYRTAAAKRGVSPSTMQAVVWVTIRNHADMLR
jgi:hypothetical protein